MKSIFDSITPYGIMTLIAFIVCISIIVFLARRKNMFNEELIFVMISAFIGGFLGAHILYFLVGLPDFISGLSLNPPVDVGDFLLKVYYAASGLVYYGGLLGALLGIWIYCHAKKIPLHPTLNLFAVIFPLFHGLGRIGCVLTGCCYGIEYHGIFAITYDESAIVEGLNDHIVDFPRFPVQPLEALLEFIMFAVLLTLYLKRGDKFSVLPPYLLAYAVIRFFDEFLRGDEIRGIFGPFSTSQWIAIFVFIITLIYLLVRRSKKNNNPDAFAKEL